LTTSRPASALGTDAGMNLVNALRVASSAEARGKGVLVVLNDEIHAARDVVKTSTYRLQTFRSADFGALGHADGDGVHFYRAPLRTHMPDTQFARLDLTALPRVEIIYSYAGADGALVDAAVAAGARGLVSAGFAPGSPTPDQRAAFERAAKSGIVHRPRRPAPPPARKRHRRRPRFQPAKSPHPLNAGTGDDDRSRQDPGGVSDLLSRAPTGVSRLLSGARATSRIILKAKALGMAHSRTTVSVDPVR